MTTKQSMLPQSDSNTAVASGLGEHHLNGRIMSGICTNERTLTCILLPMGGGNIH